MEEITMIFEKLNTIPPPVLLAVALAAIRLLFLKVVPHVWLNVFAIVAGAALMPLLVPIGKFASYDIPHPTVHLAIQGIIAGVISIAINSGLRKFLASRKISIDGDTEITTKEQANEKVTSVPNSAGIPDDGVREQPESPNNG